MVGGGTPVFGRYHSKRRNLTIEVTAAGVEFFRIGGNGVQSFTCTLQALGELLSQGGFERVGA